MRYASETLIHENRGSSLSPATPLHKRPANWNPRTEAPADWQYVADICAERGEFEFSEIHAEYKRLQAVRNAA